MTVLLCTHKAIYKKISFRAELQWDFKSRHVSEFTLDLAFAELHKELSQIDYIKLKCSYPALPSIFDSAFGVVHQ